MKKLIHFTCLCVVFSFPAKSQNNVGIGTTTPTAKLEVSEVISGTDAFLAKHVAGSVLDVFTVEGGGLFSLGFNPWQAFDPNSSGTLDHIDLKLQAGGNDDITTDVMITIYSGIGTDGSVLASFSQTVTFFANVPTWNSFPVPGAIPILESTFYTVMASNGSGAANWLLQGGNPYVFAPSISPNFDFNLKVYMATFKSLKLDSTGTTVANKLKVTDGAANGFVLKSDASGNASWVNPSSIESDPQVGSNAVNYLPKWNGTTLINGSIFDNGNVGIGTSTPADIFQIGDYLDYSDHYLSVKTIGGNLHKAGIKFRHFSDGYGWTLVSDETATKFNIIRHFNNVTGSIALSIDGFNGNVGVGTTSPSTKLDVEGTTQTNALQVSAFGTVFNRVQAGTASLGSGQPGVNTYTVSFPPNAFIGIPKVMVTVRGENYDDTFSATTRNINTSSFQVNIDRTDSTGPWVQNLQLDWFAWE